MRTVTPDSQRIENLNGKKGTYALLVQVVRPLRIQVGKLGRHRFPEGIYVYVGSAMGRSSTSLGHRLRRHFSNAAKKKHWHIDYLLANPGARAIGAIWAETEKSVECELASGLWDRGSVFEAWVDGFGASDCREGCGAHLFRHTGSGGLKAVRATVRQAFRGMGLSATLL